MDPRVIVKDDFLLNPETYRREAISRQFTSRQFGSVVFRGIADAGTDSPVAVAVESTLPYSIATLSFFRKSPQGQPEPNFIHTDADMGDWTALLYLTQNPPPEDGTVFWNDRASGLPEGTVNNWHQYGNDPERWIKSRTVRAKFNRLVIFPAQLFHSRAIHGNYGAGDGARLVQVVFGKFADGRGSTWQ